jgi:iron complex transport system substrate-binding protein
MQVRLITRAGRLRPLVAGLAVLAITLGACARAASPPASGSSVTSSASPESRFPLTLKDDDGVSITLRTPPQRIVTWGPSNTEILFALGAGSRVVGVSGPFDDSPVAARSITRVGGKSGVSPDIEKVVSLQPDLVLNAFLGGDQWYKQLRDLGIPVFSIHATTFDDALHDIRTVGQLTATEQVADAVDAQMAMQAARVRAAVAIEPHVTCFLEEGYPGIYTVGPGSIEFDLLERAGCDPITGSAKDAYPSWSVEQLVKADPQVYLLTSEAGVSPKDVAARPGFAGIAAVKAGKVLAISSDLLSRPGPRVADGLTELAKLLHPDAFGLG